MHFRFYQKSDSYWILNDTGSEVSKRTKRYRKQCIEVDNQIEQTDAAGGIEWYPDWQMNAFEIPSVLGVFGRDLKNVNTDYIAA